MLSLTHSLGGTSCDIPPTSSCFSDSASRARENLWSLLATRHGWLDLVLWAPATDVMVTGLTTPHLYNNSSAKSSECHTPFAWRVWIVSHNNLSTDQRRPHRWAFDLGNNECLFERVLQTNRFLKLKVVLRRHHHESMYYMTMQTCVCAKDERCKEYDMWCDKSSSLTTYLSNCTWHLKPLCIGPVQSTWDGPASEGRGSSCLFT